MGVATFMRQGRYLDLPAPPYELWLHDELDNYVNAPDGARVEVIGGEIVVSPAPLFGHAVIISEVQEQFIAAKLTDPDCNWQSLQNTGLNVAVVADGYIPDIVVMSKETFERASADPNHILRDDEAQLVVEVTSRSNCADDRKPGPKRERRTKWNGYASAGIPFYLLIDRDPKVMSSTLYSEPHRAGAIYTASQTWPFGETIELPQPFGMSIATDRWFAWHE